MIYSVKYSDEARKDLKKMDRHQSKRIITWIEKNLIGCTNPRQRGKPLHLDHKGEWRYRIGVYRLIADIKDNIVTIEIINVGHRKEIYSKR